MKNKRFILKTEINSFHYLYQDADYFMSVAKQGNIKNTFEETRIARSGMLLYIMSLEALINRALGEFISEPLNSFVMEREAKFSTLEKWELLTLTEGEPPVNIDFGKYPWNHFKELIKVRNDYIHPKHNRTAYLEAKTFSVMEYLNWKKIPKDIDIKQKDLIYVQTKLPKDPYGFRLEHLKTVKKIVDETVSCLDKIMKGKILKNN